MIGQSQLDLASCICSQDNFSNRLCNPLGTLYIFPEEMLLKCFSYLSMTELLKIGLLNRSFLQLSRDNSLWRLKFPAAAAIANAKGFNIFKMHLFMSNSYEFKGHLCAHFGADPCSSNVLKGRYIINLNFKYVKVLDLQNREWRVLNLLKEPLKPKSLAVSINQNLIFYSSNKKLVGITLHSLKPFLQKKHDKDAFSQCEIVGNRLVTWHWSGGPFDVWEIKNKQLIHRITIVEECLHPILGEGVLVAGNKKNVNVWDLEKCTLRTVINADINHRICLIKNRLFEQDFFGNVNCFSLLSGRKMRTYGNAQTEANSGSLSVNEKYIVSVGKKGRLTVFNWYKHKEVVSINIACNIVKQCEVVGERIYIVTSHIFCDLISIYHAPTGNLLKGIDINNIYYPKIHKILVNEHALVVECNDKKWCGRTFLYMLSSARFPKLEGNLTPPRETKSKINNRDRLLQKARVRHMQNQSAERCNIL